MPTAIVAAPANRTIGRASELREIAERLHAASVRLLTLTGPGGVGKTRLAFEAAAAVATDFADGAHIVSLAAARRPHEVPAAIVRSLGIILLSGESPEDAVERFLAAKHLLLVLDNCEQVPAAAPFIGRLPAVCPDVTVLATSREPLNVHAEHRYPVAPLALPEPGASEEPGTLAGIDSVALFCERARAHDPAFTLEDGNAVAVAEICRRVDGLPLAIELAAAGCALRSPGEIAERLHAALSTPGAGARDAPARQRTLAATIDWSYELLSDGERDCFARFAVFAGGATLDAAEAITGADLGTLDGLVAKSLLVRRRDAQAATRVGMLETVRVYAGERLVAAGDRTAAHERHYRHYLALAERHASERALCGADGNDHLARLDADIENLHAALAWATDECEVQHALRLISALGSYWVMRSRYDDALRCIDQALQLSGADAHPALCFRALRTKALCLWPVGRGAEQLAVLAKAEALARRLGDPLILAQALHARAVCEITHERRAVADGLADEALHWARAAGDEWQIAEACRAKAIAASNISDLRRRVDAAASQLTAVGNLRRLASLFAASTYAALCLGSERDAMPLAERASAIASSLDDPYTTMITEGNRGLIALLTGALGEAAKAFCSELEACRDMVVRPLVSEGLSGLAAVAVADACDERAARLLGAAAAHRRDKDRDPVETRLEEEFFTPARTRLGAESWDTAAREGSALSFEDAIAYALAAPRAPVPVHRQATR